LGCGKEQRDRWGRASAQCRPDQADIAVAKREPHGQSLTERTRQEKRACELHAEIVRSVSTTKAYLSFHGRMWKVPQAFCGERLAIRQLTSNGRYGVFFAAHQIATIDLTNKQSVSHLSEHLSPISPG